MSLFTKDKKALEEIHRLFLELEKESKNKKSNLEKLDNLKNRIKDLFNSENGDIIRLSAMAKHLTPEMTLKHFSAYAIPFERLLKKNIKDDDFIVLADDKLETITEKIPLVFVLNNIRSAFNVGSIFRTAECLNVEKVFLCGYTATPEQETIEKTAMGTQKWVTWDYHFKAIELVEKLKKDYVTIAMETTTHAKDISDNYLEKPTAFIFGNERYGLEPELISICDEVRAIPMRGQKNSLNVGVPAAVAGFEWYRQWKK